MRRLIVTVIGVAFVALPAQARPGLTIRASLSQTNTTDRTMTPDSTNLQTVSPYTIIEWVYPTAFTTNRRLYSKSSSAGTTRRHVLIAATTGTMTGFQDFTGGGAVDASFTTSTTLTLNRWNLVVVTFDGSNLQMYLGSETAPPQEVSYASIAAGSGTLGSDAGEGYCIGNSDTSSFARAFEGSIAYFQLVVKGLSKGELLEWYRRYQQLGYPPPAAADVRLNMWLGEDGATSVMDWSGNNNHGTITGARPTMFRPFLPLARRRLR